MKRVALPGSSNFSLSFSTFYQFFGVAEELWIDTQPERFWKFISGQTLFCFATLISCKGKKSPSRATTNMPVMQLLPELPVIETDFLLPFWP